MKALKLGSKQQMALHALVRKNGSSGWKIGSWKNTEKLLDSLVAKGLAVAIMFKNYTHYEATPLGVMADKGNVTLLKEK